MNTNSDILFKRTGPLALVTLNRPQAMNALTLEMAVALRAQLAQWAAEEDVKAVLIEGAGDRAFCAGGDIRKLYDEGLAKGQYPYDFYREEYLLNIDIHHYPKPYIAYMDGIVMGGGVGVSVHGSHRIVSERVGFAMPETGIGLFPDVGGSYFLSRLDDQLGMFLAMTGSRLRMADALYTGVGDYFVPTTVWPSLQSALADALNADNDDPYRIVAAVIDHHCRPPEAASLKDHAATIADAFSDTSVEAILFALDRSDGNQEWAQKQAAIMRTKSPTSMKVAYRQIRTGADLDFDACMQMEYRIANGCIQGHDFYEGVRAVVIDKDQKPQWRPATLAEVTEADIDPYFSATPNGGDLPISDRKQSDMDE